MTDKSQYIVVRAIPVEQPIGEFYVAAIDGRDLLHIAHADVRRIIERDIERIVGIQRPLSDTRVAELKQYVNSVDATFPTSIIVSISSEHAEYNVKTSELRILKDQEVAKIIDGQHRLAGFEDYKGAKRFLLNTTIFIDMELEDQAYTFATINLKQTKVSKSLAYDLYEYATTRSPQKTCHHIARLMHSKEGSPFKGRIKILGTATGERYQFVTQAAFVEGLLKHICKSPKVAMDDRNTLKAGKKVPYKPSEDDAVTIFRGMFVRAEDEKILATLWNYFNAVKRRWGRAWNFDHRGAILNRTAGLNGLMRFLGDAYLAAASPGDVPKEDAFYKIFERVDIHDNGFSTDTYKPGTSGEAQLYNDLMKAL